MQSKICIIYLVHGTDLEDFLENSLLSLRSSGFSMDVIIYTSAEAISSVKDIAARYRADVSEIDSQEIKNDAQYVPFGSYEFNAINLKKWELVIETLKLGYECVVFSDVDIAYTSDFSPYLLKAMNLYSCGLQSQNQDQFPPMYCTGFMFFTKGALNLLQELKLKSVNFAAIGSEEHLFNTEVGKQPHLSKEILLLPEGLFQNGLYFQTYQVHDFAALRGKLKPFMFHANFVIGLAAKRELLSAIGHWHLQSEDLQT